jgi:hypothetical protein
VTWRVISACEVGTSHVAVGKPCEDSVWAQALETSAGVPVLGIFVSDGAGSAAHGGRGAELAVQAAALHFEEKVKQAEFGLNEDLALQFVEEVRQRVYAQAEAESLIARDFACTFLGLVSTPQGSVAFQIGDGAIVVDVGDGLEVAVEPMAGEYANMTHFVTDEDAVSVLVAKVYAASVQRAAAFSDGLQRLALNMAAGTPHEPFFRPFFDVLSKSRPDQEEELGYALVKFLGSGAVNERTDDDKTLAVAVMQLQ